MYFGLQFGKAILHGGEAMEARAWGSGSHCACGGTCTCACACCQKLELMNAGAQFLSPFYWAWDKCVPHSSGDAFPQLNTSGYVCVPMVILNTTKLIMKISHLTDGLNSHFPWLYLGFHVLLLRQAQRWRCGQGTADKRNTFSWECRLWERAGSAASAWFSLLPVAA